MKSRNILMFFTLLALLACKPEIDEFSPRPGDADFTSFVALGSSSLAGMADYEVYKSAQENSIANILAGQFKLAGGGDFKQPLMNDELGFGAKLVLGMVTDCKGVSSLGPLKAGGTPDPANSQPIGNQGPFHNLGVPGTKSFMASIAGYGSLNPYFGRFSSSPGASMLGDAVLANPTFFTLWLGMDDVMRYASSGGDNSVDSITPANTFNLSMQAVVAGLISTGAKGAIVNIPDITTFPFFTTVPSKGLVIDAASATALNQAYATYNAGAAQLGVPAISFQAGNNYWIIQDESAPYNQLGGLRQMKAGEMLLLTVPQDSLKCAYWGSQKKIPAYYVLDINEIQKIKDATTTFNGILGGLAQENGLLLVDVHTYFKNFPTGLVFDGVKYNATFVTGGIFSLDGIHFNPRGNAIAANYILEAINGYYGSKLPLVNAGDYPGVLFP